MIERFNFYDLYGYLIPGFVWLLVLGFPFQLQFSIGEFSAGMLTASLIIGYVVGHLLSGLARQALPSSRYLVNDQKVQKSVAILAPDYRGDDRMPDELSLELGKCFAARFHFNPVAPFDLAGAKQMFFLCRAALAHAKLGAYVEQYQGMGSLTRSLALATWTGGFYYASWVTLSTLHRIVDERSVQSVLPLVSLAIAVLMANAVKNSLKGEGAINLTGTECMTVAGVLLMVAAAHSWWSPLNSRQSHQLAIAAAAMWIASLRFKNASESFEASLAMAVFRDFVVMATAKPHPGATETKPE